MFSPILTFQKFCNQQNWAPSTLKNGGRTAAVTALGLLAIYLIVLPTAQTIALRNLAFFLLIIVTLWSARRYKFRLHLPLATPWLLYAATALISLTYAVDPIWSLGEIKKEIGYGLIVLMLFASWIRNPEALNRLIIIMIIGNLLQIGAVLYKVMVLNPFWHHTFLELCTLLYTGDGKSLYNGVGNLSTYLITVMPLIAAYAIQLPRTQHVARAFIFVLLALDVLALYLTGNRMGLIVLAAELIFAVGYFTLTIKKTNGRHILIGAAITLLVIGILAFASMQERSPVDNIRWKMWDWVIADIRTAPLSGGGFGRTVMILYDPGYYKAFGLEHAHNMLLDNGVQMGLPGIATFLFLWGMSARALWPRRKLIADFPLYIYALGATTMVVGVFLKNMTDDFFVSHGALLYWALVGGVLGALTEQQTSAKTQNQ